MSTTESAATRFVGVETWPTADMVAAMTEGQMAAVATLQAIGPQLAAAIDAMVPRLQAGGRLIYLGAGTPVRAVEGAEDDGPAAIAALDAAGLTPRDVVIGIAASGRTPFTVAGVDHAHALGALTIGVFNNPGGALGEACAHPLLVATGAEIVAGSTRMKAGTAQKAVLNILSTGVFLRLGHVWRGRMVEMAPTNAKLRGRAVEMVAELADVPFAEAERALAEAGTIKHAVVMLARGVTAEEAARLLKGCGGRLDLALGAMN